MNQQIIDLYGRFTHGELSRRTFLDRLAELTGSVAAAAALVPMLQSDYARAETIPANDPRLAAERITFDSPVGKIGGYLVRPMAKGKRPAILVIHQNRGLDPHIQDVTRRFGAEGYLALAVDLLSPEGGTPSDDDPARDDKSRALFAKLNRDDSVKILVAGVSFLKSHPESTGKVGTVGFCFGGGMVDLLAMNRPDLDAAVAYYGPIPDDKTKVKDINAPLLLHYAGNDGFVNPKVPDFEAALKANNKRYTAYTYPGVQHGFNDDTAGPRYDKAAADLAWSRTLAFFRENLGAPPNAE